MNILIITDNVTRCFKYWLRHKIPQPIVHKVVFNNKVVLKNGLNYYFASGPEKIKGYQIDNIIIDEINNDMNFELLKEGIARFNYYNGVEK